MDFCALPHAVETVDCFPGTPVGVASREGRGVPVAAGLLPMIARRRRGLSPPLGPRRHVGWSVAIVGLVLALAIQLLVAPAGAVTLRPGDIVVTALAPEKTVIVVDPLGPPASNQTVISSGGDLRTPTGVAIVNGPSGYSILVVDSTCCGGKGGVIAVNPTDGSQTIVSPVSGATSVFANPLGIAVSPDGAVFVVDDSCCGSRGGVIAVAADGSQTVVSSGQLFQAPAGIAVTPRGDGLYDLYVADGAVGLIQVSLPGGSQTPVPITGARVLPRAVASAGSSVVIIESSVASIAQVIPANGELIAVSMGQLLVMPVALAVAGMDVVVVDERCCPGGNGAVIAVSRTGPFNHNQAILAEATTFASPTGIAVVPGTIAPPGGTCGGTVPCACGDRVVRDRTLRGADPITRTVCEGDGLVVADQVTLDLGGATLRGLGTGAGVRIEPGATGVAVRRGTVRGFATGVLGESGSGVHVANLEILGNTGDGVALSGDGQTIERSASVGNGGFGMALFGNGSRLSSVRASGNARAGIGMVGNEGLLEQVVAAENGGSGVELRGDRARAVALQARGNGGSGALLTGTGNAFVRSAASRNAGDGLRVEGDEATIELNQLQDNAGAGLELHGGGHVVSRNVAGRNRGGGLELLGAAASRLDRNRGENNGAFGFADDSRGTGTGGTANIYTGDICGRGNAAGGSSPAGLCR